MGIQDSDLLKPKIAVVNSSSQLSVCYAHVDGVVALLADEIRSAGGLPFEIRTAAPSDFVTSAGRAGRYLMPTRDLIVNDIEVAVEGALLDGMVCVSSCDKTTPAHLMAAARLDIPTIVVVGGYQLGGACMGRPVDIDDVYESVGAVASGGMSIDELTEMTEVAIVGPGVCAGLGTANTMHILAEALGMALPGSSPVRAGSERMLSNARDAGRRIVELVEDDLRPRDILTAEAIQNAVAVDLAIAGSVNSIRHLQAIAVEASLDVDVRELVEATNVPTIVAIRPNGPYRIEDLERAGGTQAVMRRLSDHLGLSARTVAGGTVADLVATATVLDDEIVRDVDDPFRSDPGLALLRGNLAPEGALVKLGGVPRDRLAFSGPSVIFETEDDAILGIGDGRLRPGVVAVLRGMGPKGGPGTVFAAGFVAALNGAGLSKDVACVTDGELSGLNRGLIVGQVMPEAAEGGPLALLLPGETITINIPARTIDMEVEASEIATRRAGWRPPAAPTARSVLTQYWHLVQPLSDGAVLAPAAMHLPRAAE